jgi:hypothetical protein
MPDYVPSGDPDFNQFVLPFVAYCVANGPALGLAPAQTAALNSLLGVWTTSFGAHNTAQLAAKSATAAKDTARTDLELLLREVAQFVQGRSATTDAQRQSLGLPVYDGTRTPTAPITSRPIIRVDTAQRMRHTIRVTDEGTPNSRRRPEGAMGFELWCKHGGPLPSGLADCDYLGTVVRSPNVEEFEPGDAGVTIHYIARWMNKAGDPGPISETVSATVPA